MDEIEKAWDLLIEGEYFTEDELTLVTRINGYSIETLNDCIFARYGSRSIEQLTEELL